MEDIPKQKYTIKTRTVSEAIEDIALTFVLQDESKSTLATVPNLSKITLCNKSPVVYALLNGGFAESTQQVLTLKLPEELPATPDYISAWCKFWELLADHLDIQLTLQSATDNEVFAIATMADMYSISKLTAAISEQYASGTVHVNPTTLYTANIINCVEKLICPPGKLAPNNEDIPRILSESIDIDDAFLLMRLWSTHQLANAGVPFIDLTGETWPLDVGIPLTTNTAEILDTIVELSQDSLGESGQDLLTYMAIYKNLSLAGGAVLHAVSTHPTRGKGATDIDIWIHEATDDEIIRAITEHISYSHNMLIANNNSVLTIMGTGLARQIQLIHTETYDVRGVLLNFDNPAIQVGLQWNESKKRVCLYCTVDFLDAMRTGRTAWWNLQSTRPARMRKYVDRGFSVPPEYESFVPGPHDKSVILAELKGFTFHENPANEHEKIKLETTAQLINPLFTDARYVTSYDEYLTVGSEYVMQWLKTPLGKASANYDTTERMFALQNGMKCITLTSCKLAMNTYSKWFLRNIGNEDESTINRKLRIINPDDEFMKEAHKILHNKHIIENVHKDIVRERQHRNLPIDHLYSLLWDDFSRGSKIRVKLSNRCKIVDTATGMTRDKLTPDDEKRNIKIEGFIQIALISNTFYAFMHATRIVLGPRDTDIL